VDPPYAPPPGNNSGGLINSLATGVRAGGNALINRFTGNAPLPSPIATLPSQSPSRLANLLVSNGAGSQIVSENMPPASMELKGPENMPYESAGITSFSQLPADFQARYSSNRRAGRTTMSPEQATAYYRSNYAGTDRTLPPMAAASPQPAASSSGQIASFDQLPPQLQEAYKQRSASRQTQMTPSQAVEFYNNNYVNGVRLPQSTPGALPVPTAAAMAPPSSALPTPSLDSLPQPTASLRNNQGGYINPLNDPTQRGVDPDEALAYADAEAANAELSAQRGAASARLAEVRRSLGNGAAESEGRAQAVRDAETAARNSLYGYRTGDSGVTRRGVYTPTPSMSDSNPGAFPERESERQVREWSDNTDQRLGGILADRNARMQSDQDARYAEIMRNMEARRNTRAQGSRVVSSGPRRSSI
jgi:hypothetical protein